MIDPFYRDFIFDEEQMAFLKQNYEEHKEQLSRAKVYDDTGQGGTIHESRQCDNVSIQHLFSPDISMALNDAARYDWGTDFPDDAWFAQFEYIRYCNPHDRFEKHTDDNPQATTSGRIFTSVTMINRSDDLEGCELTVWTPPNENEYVIDLEEGETVMFPAWYYHQANPLFKGERVVLISWCQHKAYRNQV